VFESPLQAHLRLMHAWWHLQLLVLAAGCLLSSEVNAQTMAVSPSATSSDGGVPKAWVRMDVGASGVMAPGSPTYVGYGIHILGLRVELPHVAFLLVPRFANFMAPAEHGQSMLRLDGSLGARYLFFARPRSPFLGGGLTYGLTSIDDTPGVISEAKGTGAGAYVEAGYEFYRSTWYQVSTGLRVDTPFYRAHSELDRIHRHHYVVPVSLDITISIPWPTGLWLR
jgi:hypothetical protein